MMNRKITIGTGIAAMALAFGATAHAQAPATTSSVSAPKHHGFAKDADKNGVITRAEAQNAANAAFDRMDANKDGKLDKVDRDLQRTAMREKAFSRLDTDNSGSISKAEYLAVRGAKDGDAKRPGASGKMGQGEMGHARFRGHGGGMMHADADKNGSISKAEFTTAAMTRFDAMDSNKDGQVSADERKAARATMRDQRRGPPPAQPTT